MPKEKKSFKKFATKHLAKKIELRRKNREVKKEMKERDERKIRRNAKQATEEEREHQSDLLRLKETDPEFLEYLEKEEANLLDFGADDAPVVDDDAGSDAETDAGDEDEEAAGGDGGDDEQDDAGIRPGRISSAEVASVCKEKNFAEAFLLLCCGAREMGYKLREAPSHAKARRRFDSPEAVRESLVQPARLYSSNVASLVHHDAATGKEEVKPAFKNLVRRMINCLLTVMSEANHDGPLLVQLAHAFTAQLRFLPLVRGSTKATLRTMLPMCAHAEEATRVAAYLVVSTLAKKMSGSRSLHQSALFKGMFLTLVRAVREYNIRALPIVGFLMNCVVDLYGTDMEAAYQHAFTYIRQLAIYLRQVLQNPSQQNVRAVFNWQYLNALRTWGLVVSTYYEPNRLGPLIHPVVQIALGLMDLFSSPRMFPMHLHVIEMLNHLASRSGVYVPISSYVLRILTSSFMSLDAESTRKSNRDAAANPDELDLQFCLRVKKRHARSVPFRVNVWKESLYLLSEHLAFLSHSIGLPEVSWAVRSTLAKLKRDVKIPKVNGAISALLHKLDETCKLVRTRRDQVHFGPCNIAEVRAFEEKLRGECSPASGKSILPLVPHFEQLRAARIAEFAAKQQALGPRSTLDAAVRTKQSGGKRAQGKRRRSDVHDDDDDDN